MSCVGTDPGLTGAIAWLHREPSGDIIGKVFDMPTLTKPGKSRVSREVDPFELACIVRGFACHHAVIEHVQSYSKQGVAGMFSLGHSYGVAMGVLAGNGMAIEAVRPQEWKKAFGLIGQDKSASIDAARDLVPALADQIKLKKHHGRAEAILLAYFGLVRGCI